MKCFNGKVMLVSSLLWFIITLSIFILFIFFSKYSISTERLITGIIVVVIGSVGMSTITWTCIANCFPNYAFKLEHSKIFKNHNFKLIAWFDFGIGLDSSYKLLRCEKTKEWWWIGCFENYPMEIRPLKEGEHITPKKMLKYFKKIKYDTNYCKDVRKYIPEIKNLMKGGVL